MENGAKLALEDGTIVKGESFGYETTKIGEVVFSTGMVGYTESLTDPSFKGQILMSTYPLEGNYGVSEEHYQSEGIQVDGFIVREVCKKPSRYTSQKTLNDFLEEFEIPGISGIDTRDLTLKIRTKGSMKGALTTEDISDEELLDLAKSQKSIVDRDLVPLVSTKETQVYGEDNKHMVAIIDCGVKTSIIENFLNRDIGVVRVPYDTAYQDILDYGVDGLLVSCGPGNPARLTETIDNVSHLTERLPMFGICMGQLVIAKTFGAKTFKMKFGHRGGNQPVKDLNTGKVYITSQNHGFAVDADSLKGTDLELAQVSLNDGTPEGFLHKELPIKTIQYHPEATPGPTDTNMLFDEFKETIINY